MKKIVLLLSTLVMLSSCVSTKKFNQMATDNKAKTEELRDCRKAALESEKQAQSLEEENKRLKKAMESSGEENYKRVYKIAELEKENTDLKVQLDSANKKISEVIADKSEHLSELSDVLYKREEELNSKAAVLDSLENEFANSRRQMKMLKEQLEGKQAQLDKIQKTLKDALWGFSDKGLTVETNKGKVYVKMEEKLLFSSGSWEVNPQGVKALQEIAAVLANNKDLDVLVEGHTDNVPLAGKNQIKDNWDLSVMRATAITKILLDKTGISPDRIVPCGRGEYMPVTDNKTAEGRAKNRRTEIILSPKVNELMDIII